MSRFLLRYRFRLLFACSVFLTAILGWPQPPKWLELGALLLLVLAGINTLWHRQVFLRLVGFIGAVNLLLLAFGNWLALPAPITNGLALILLYLALFIALFRRVTQERPVTSELLYGLIALYLQIALAFAFGYQVIGGFWPDAFHAGQGPLQLDDFIYFSLTTLTTLGYGDIHAIGPAARLLAVSEAVVGVLFIALTVARSLSLLNDKDDSL